MKTDENGVEQWNKTYGGANADYGYSTKQTSDGGYILAGQTNSFGSGAQAYLVKANETGVEQWTKTFGGAGSEEGRSVQQTTDGG